jgi:hypothetical protein
MTITNEIKPCPFCGSAPQIIERKCCSTKYAIGCSNIECAIFLPPDVKKRELHNYTWCYFDKDEMIKRWNRRP